MAHYVKPRKLCPFCGAGKEHHKLKAGAGGYAVHMGCRACGCLGPKVDVPINRRAWRVVDRGEFPELARQARNLFYGIKDPVPSSRVPVFP